MWSGVAAIVGGVLYAVKAGVILLGGSQPAYLFEAAPIAFGTSLLLLGWTWPGSLARSARILAAIIVVAGVLNVVEDVFADEEAVPALSSLVDVVAGFGPVVALLLLGLALRRGNDPAPPGPMPLLAMAALYPLALLSLGPLSLVVDIDSPSGERWIEVSILAIGLGWIWLGATVRGARRPLARIIHE